MDTIDQIDALIDSAEIEGQTGGVKLQPEPKEVRVVPVFQKLLKVLLKGCQALYGPRLVAIAVFGSVGRGTPRPDSDVDILIVADSLPDGRIRRVEEFHSVEQKLRDALCEAQANGVDTYLSPIFKTPAEVSRGSALFLDMLHDVQILFDRKVFFAGELEKFRERLAHLKARRIWRGDAWFWDLKPDFQPGEVFEL